MADPIEEYIKSGILGLYVLGLTSEEDNRGVLEMANAFPQVAHELEKLHAHIEAYGRAQAVDPPSGSKAFVMAAVDFMERREQGERPLKVPVLSAQSKIQDFEPWLERADMQLPEMDDEVFARVLGMHEGRTTCIVWVKHKIEEEIHRDEHESFLVVEGSCKLFLGENIHWLSPGDYISIPLHVEHSAIVTSEGPCKIILEHAPV